MVMRTASASDGHPNLRMATGSVPGQAPCGLARSWARVHPYWHKKGGRTQRARRHCDERDTIATQGGQGTSDLRRVPPLARLTVDRQG
jgi:hypothetical protein